MKKFNIVLVSVLVSFLLFTGVFLMASNSTEKQISILEKMNRGEVVPPSDFEEYRTLAEIEKGNLDALNGWVGPSGEAVMPVLDAKSGFGIKLIYHKIFTSSDELTSVTIPIPAGGSHLRLISSVRVKDKTGVAPLVCTFNGDTGQNYWHHVLNQWDGTLSTSGFDIGSIPYIYCGGVVGTDATLGQYGSGVADIIGYNNPNTFTTIHAISSQQNTGNFRRANITWGSWESTDAVTSITVRTADLGTFEAGSTISLYMYE